MVHGSLDFEVLKHLARWLFSGKPNEKLAHDHAHGPASNRLAIMPPPYADEMQTLENLEVRTGGTVPLLIEEILLQMQRLHVIQLDNVFLKYVPDDEVMNNNITETKHHLRDKHVLYIDPLRAPYAYLLLVRIFAHLTESFLTAVIFGQMVNYQGKQFDSTF